MSLYSPPPPLRDFDQDKPTLLVCWWITTFCATIILLRVAGRFVRTERLFMEDKVAALALIPLFLRMGFVHVVLVFGTNNAQLADADLSPEQIRQKTIASGLVLGSRILYAATLWILKSAILEFFKRLTGVVTWERSYATTLLAIRCILIATFVATVISDLAECHPFTHYWQVLPDPGGQCRQGYAQLLTMSACNVITDLLLVLFPIPIILRSNMTVTKKVQLVLLFSMSLAVVAVTLYRVPHVIWAQGSQQTRSLLASVELLFATAAANALVLGSFVRDRGVKKKKFKYGSIVDSLNQTDESRSRRPTMNRHWGSDEDLVRDLGLGVNPELREMPDSPGIDVPPVSYTPAGPAPTSRMADHMRRWQFPGEKRTDAVRSEDSLLPGDQLTASHTNSTVVTPRRVSFLDVGGLLGSEQSDASRRASHVSGVDPLALQGPTPAMPASASGLRRGSTAFLQDIGGLLAPSPAAPNKPRSKSKNGTELESIPQSREPPAEPPAYQSSAGRPDLDFLDPGGLLGPRRSS